MYQIVTVDKVEASVDFDAPLFLDTESVELYGKTRLVQIYQEAWDHVLMVEHPSEVWIQDLMSRGESVFHNAHYDITTMQQNAGNRFIPERFVDTFLAARLAFPRADGYTLDEVMTHVS